MKSYAQITCAAALVAMTCATTAGAAVDGDAAKRLARSNNCLRCHGLVKQKDGPTYHDVAVKYRGKADAEDTLVHHLTAGVKIKFKDGHQEFHKAVKAPDEGAVRNLALWILAQ